MLAADLVVVAMAVVTAAGVAIAVADDVEGVRADFEDGPSSIGKMRSISDDADCEPIP